MPRARRGAVRAASGRGAWPRPAGGAGWARRLEVRLHGRVARAMGWVWPVCFLVVGATLLLYREV